MANKKIPFKYARPVEEWLQEKGNFKQACFYAYMCSLHCLYNVEVHTENIAHRFYFRLQLIWNKEQLLWYALNLEDTYLKML